MPSINFWTTLSTGLWIYLLQSKYHTSDSTISKELSKAHPFGSKHWQSMCQAMLKGFGPLIGGERAKKQMANTACAQKLYNDMGHLQATLVGCVPMIDPGSWYIREVPGGPLLRPSGKWHQLSFRKDCGSQKKNSPRSDYESMAI